MPNGLAAVEAAAGFAPASPTVVDMLTEGRRKLSCRKSRTKKLSTSSARCGSRFSRRQAVGIALGDKDTVSELLDCAAECAQSRLDAIGWSEFSATKVPTFSLTALEGRGEIAGISRLHLSLACISSLYHPSTRMQGADATRCKLAHTPFSPLRRWETCW